MSIIKKADLERHRASRRAKNLLAFRPTANSAGFTRQPQAAPPIVLGSGTDECTTLVEATTDTFGQVVPIIVGRPRS